MQLQGRPSEASGRLGHVGIKMLVTRGGGWRGQHSTLSAFPLHGTTRLHRTVNGAGRHRCSNLQQPLLGGRDNCNKHTRSGIFVTARNLCC